jgi:hypothetical protein
MANNERKKRPVFQSSEETPKVRIDPPFNPADDVILEEITGENYVAGAELDEIDQEIGVEEPESPPIAESEASTPQNWLSNGWRELTDEQNTGKTFYVTHDLSIEGIRGFWRKTRVLSHFRWVSSGKWTNSLTNCDIIPVPKYYKEI